MTNLSAIRPNLNSDTIASDESIDSRSTVLQISAAIILGAVMLYGVGFANMGLAHNVAHDARHTVAFPCH